MGKKLKLVVLAIVGSFHLSAFADVWKNEHQWSEIWEDKFSQWVEQSWDDEIFMRPDSLLYGIKTDCADASYTMRMYYSYINKLPFVIRHPNKPKEFLTNSIKSFDSISDERARFRKFVDAINLMTDSGSLSNDTYPIQINKKNFRAGIVYVSPNDHTYQIKSIDLSGIPIVYASTVPQEARYLQILNSYPFYIPSDIKNYRDGYRAFKQPHHYSMSPSLISGYGLDQWELGLMAAGDLFIFGELIAQKIQTIPETNVGKIKRLLLNICSAIQLRAIHISWTESRKLNQYGRCLTHSEYENESTPSRDKRIVMMYNQLEKTFKATDLSTADGYFEVAKFVFNESIPGHVVEKWCPISTSNPGSEKINLRTVYLAIRDNKLISDPHANFEQRWGFEDYSPVCR